jgi:hypothetical protein
MKRSTAGIQRLPDQTTGSTRCTYMCRAPATVTVVSPTAIGQRIEQLCAEHAVRREQQNAELLAAWERMGVLAIKERRAAA